MVIETKNKTAVLVSADQMAAELGVKTSWIYHRTMERGTEAIPRMKIGKHLRFNREEVFNWFTRKQK
jgi:predicted DNA-binding transcriptional regulator AlpA